MAQESRVAVFFVTYPDLARQHGITYTREHINRLINRGEFPASVQLSANRIAWRLADIEAWKASRPVARPWAAPTEAA